MPPLFNATICDKVSPKAGDYDLSLYLRHTCGYQLLRLSRSLGYRPAALPFPTERSLAAPWVQLARPLSAAIPLWVQRSASRLARSPIQVRSIWANLCGRRASSAARGLVDFPTSRLRLGPERVQARPSLRAVTWSQVVLRSTFCTVRQIRTNATTQACRFKHRLANKTRALALRTFGKGAALSCAFSRLGRPSHV